MDEESEDEEEGAGEEHPVDENEYWARVAVGPGLPRGEVFGMRHAVCAD